MSPVAVGSPHTRAFSVDTGRPVDMPPNGTRTNGVDGLKGANRVFAHLDDLVSAKPNVDINSPLRTILQQGEMLAKQAETHLDFKRPDIALQEYVRAAVIAVEIVPRHKDYPSLQTDRGELHRLYTGLNKRINSQHEKFAEVKTAIKENNARSGVVPASKLGTPLTAPNGAVGMHAQPQSAAGGHMNGHTGPVSSLKRSAPPIQPKPDSLHGRTISHGGGGNVSDLAARFARLQNNGSVQDPRIKTRPISISESTITNGSPSARPESKSSMVRPLGPREFPSVPHTQPRAVKIPLDVTIPGMPRPPDAIHHSPLRAVENPETVNLPSSVSRNPSYLGNGRKNSAPPISTVGPSPYVFDNRSEYFSSPAHTSNDNIAQAQTRRNPPSLPSSTSISAEELMGYLKYGQQALKLLIVDLRNREDFESGHIMAQCIICVEPITLRTGISGEELEDSMIIATNFEQDLFERRQEFDLVVFYDQSSTSIKSTSHGKDTDSVLRDFAAAVYDYGYEKRLTRHPVLLAGGLDAWIDLLGPNSLRTSGGAGGSSGLAIVSGSSHKRLAPRPQASSILRRRTRPSRLKSREEEKKWADALHNDNTITDVEMVDTPISEELVYARTTEDFFRRFPELPAQESMVSPIATPASQFQRELDSVMPRPPARPAPALPRQRSSGITEKGPTMHYAHSAGQSISNLVTQRGRTGLENPGNLCYMNAALQGISATSILREFLINFGSTTAPVPMKGKETAAPMQLMTKYLGNLLMHMWSGQYNFLTPKTYRGYVNALHSTSTHDANLSEKLRVHAFGGISRQHDSSEFLMWLIDVMDDELNPLRSVNEKLITDQEAEEDWGQTPEIVAAQNGWANRTVNERSFLTMKMKSMVQVDTACSRSECDYRRRVYVLRTWLDVILVESKTPVTLLSILTNYVGGVINELEFRCEKCYGKVSPASKGHQTFKLARIPDVLAVNIGRFGYVEETNTTFKVTTTVTFPETLDLTSLFISTQGGNINGLDHEFQPPFLYDVVSVTTHAGNQLNSGHYWTTSRNPATPSGPGARWQKFNDSYVTDENFSSTQSGTATWVFLQRQRTW
ncbi:related to ubiquitin carboxyl-terminal hydrolase [Phialocephala subalpina]|uniref:Related to ubiquitin carboxyl-terminal hydrolase n=1 Tax=Phialocephala subalpina TaxID=576137 RepID=A0A1L7WI54_9HELO|nr:related to ubiquitin carboxyl-terminal hydrolase [Phialocephala subalpina]